MYQLRQMCWQKIWLTGIRGRVSLAAASATAQYASTPPSPPAPAAPPSATIQVPGQQQYVPEPVLIMNTPTSPSQTAATGRSSSSSAGSASLANQQMYILPSSQHSTGIQQNPDSSSLLIPAGTKILLTLQRAVDTRTARLGDTVYLRSRFPVVVQGRVVLPADTYIQGRLAQITPSRSRDRAAQIQVQRITLILKNGTVVPMQASFTVAVRSAHTIRSVIPQGTPLEATLPMNLRVPGAFSPPTSTSVSADSPIPVYIPVFGPQSTSSPVNGTPSSTPIHTPAPYIK